MAARNRKFVLETVIFLAAAGVALVAVLIASLILVDATQRRTDEVARAQETRLHAYRLLIHLQDAETGQRGYVLTGNLEYLQPYRNALGLITTELAALQRAHRDEGVGEDANALSGQIAAKLEEMESTVILVTNGRRADAVALVQTDRGQRMMENIRVRLDAVISAANQRVSDRLAALRQAAGVLRWVTVGGGVLIFVFAVAGTATIWRYTRDLIAARSEVDALNADLEIRVADRTSELTRANEEIQRFAYIVSHDLRAPLVNVMGFTSELEDGLVSVRRYFAEPSAHTEVAARAAADEDIPEAIGFVRASTDKMDRLISAILKISREGGRLLSPEPVDLKALMERATESLHHQLEARDAEVHVAPDLPTITSDRLALEQVFGNLLENAVKYLSPDRPGRIEVRAKDEGSRVVIEVADNGRGIAPPDHERVFELFRRAGAQDQPGEGIGLAQVRALSRRLGGDVRVQSDRDCGATFSVILPRVLILNTETATP